MRGFAAVLIVLVHSSPDSNGMTNIIVLLAHCMIALFFILSGFVNTKK